MVSLLEKSVKKDGDGTYGFYCPGVVGDPCQDTNTGLPWSSTGWPTKKAALARGEQHFDEHLLNRDVAEAVAEARAKAQEDGKDPASVDLFKIRDEVHKKSKHKVTQDLNSFREAQGIVALPDGTAVRAEDLEQAAKGK